MKDENLDPKIDRMIAALYGELSESEERAFHRLLEKDDALRAEWEELRESRRILSGWEVEERVPSFVMLEGAAGRSAERAGAPWWRRLLAPLQGFGPGPAWAMATAAIAVAAFFLADARMDSKVEQQVASRLGSTPSVTGGTGSTGVALEDLARSRGGQGSEVVQTAGYVTRDELQDSNEQLMQSLAALLNDYSEKKDGETLDLLRAMYERVNQQQLYDYRQLAGRIDDLGRELVVSRGMAEQKIEELLGPATPRDLNGEPTPTDDGQ